MLALVKMLNGSLQNFTYVLYPIWYDASSCLKKRIMVQGVDGAGFQTAGILWYVKDLKSGPDTRIGPKDFFEMVSKKTKGMATDKSPCILGVKHDDKANYSSD